MLSDHNVLNYKSLKDTGHVINHSGKECEKEWVNMYNSVPLLYSRKRNFNFWIGKIPWRKKWQPTPVFLRGKSHGREKPDGLELLRLHHKAQIQTQSKVTVPWCWDAEFSSQGRNSIVLFAACGAIYLCSSSQAKQMLNAIFTLPVFHKSKNSLGFLLVSENG